MPPAGSRQVHALAQIEVGYIVGVEASAALPYPRSLIADKQDQGRRHVLKSIDPYLNADVLYALRSMGHGDDLVLCDTNFPADSVARQTVLGRLLRIDNVSAARAARAVLSVLPLDTFVDKPASRMEIVGQPDEIPPVQAEVQAEIDAAQGRPSPMGGVERFEFYDLAKRAYCVIQTGERRFYGCFIFKKGVVAPDAA
jgi:L-fucose mutarotase